MNSGFSNGTEVGLTSPLLLHTSGWTALDRRCSVHVFKHRGDEWIGLFLTGKEPNYQLGQICQRKLLSVTHKGTNLFVDPVNLLHTSILLSPPFLAKYAICFIRWACSRNEILYIYLCDIFFTRSSGNCYLFLAMSERVYWISKRQIHGILLVHVLVILNSWWATGQWPILRWACNMIRSR